MTIDHTSSSTAAEPFNLTSADHDVLASTDADFEPHSWDELKEILGTHCPPDDTGSQG